MHSKKLTNKKQKNSPTNKKDLGMAYRTTHLKKVKKQGEMPKFVIHIIIMEKVPVGELYTWLFYNYVIIPTYFSTFDVFFYYF